MDTFICIYTSTCLCTCTFTWVEMWGGAAGSPSFLAIKSCNFCLQILLWGPGVAHLDDEKLDGSSLELFQVSLCGIPEEG